MFQYLCITCILGCLTQSYGIHDESPCTEGTMGSGKDASEREEFPGSRQILRISSIHDTPVVKEGGHEKCRSDTDASIPSPFQSERLAERDSGKDRFEAVGAEPMRTGGASGAFERRYLCFALLGTTHARPMPTHEKTVSLEETT